MVASFDSVNLPFKDVPSPSTFPETAPDPGRGDPDGPVSSCGFPDASDGGADGGLPPLPPVTTSVDCVSDAHTERQQHRASTNRAHSRRHVVIIVSVVVQWCGADPHSEGHGEQQGRREVRQTHTQRAHHMRRGQQPGMHRTPHTTHDTHSNPRQQAHTHSPAATPTHTDGRGRSKQERHTRLHRMHIRRERSVVSAPLTEGTHTHKRIVAAHTATQKQSNNKKGEIPAYHADCWSMGSAAKIHHKNNSFFFGLRSYSAHTTSCRPGHHRSRARKNNKKKQKMGGGVGHRGAAVAVGSGRCSFFIVSD
ncbi:hypothetical protein ECC02_012221 [Trypanosoma cruzi]|uniref:Uncharacterized protein n=1 Tax=Trypanosoma cruzi TaxID=5693 RepID=A0A7J6XKX5_TRYCR|nr:hypothetical protein ECC02_012221 [Trypanosoma cruzi]